MKLVFCHANFIAESAAKSENFNDQWKSLALPCTLEILVSGW